MKIKRNKFNELIVKVVMQGKYPAYHNSKNGNKCWSLYKGRKTYISHDIEDYGVTMQLHRLDSSTLVYFDTAEASEIAEYITNHEMNFDKQCRFDEERIQYCSENPWTYSGT